MNRDSEELLLLDVSARQCSLRRDGDADPLFIFVTPQFWNFGDKPSKAAGPAHPIRLSAMGTTDVIVSVQASDVDIPEAQPTTK